MINKKPLILFHTVSHREWGGQEIRVFNESRWMARQGHRIMIAAPEGSPIFEKSEKEGWEVFSIAFTRQRILSDMLKLRSILKAVRPDVFNTHGNMDAKAGLTAAWGLGISCVILSRHITPQVSNRFYNRMLYKKLCHRVFTTSKIAVRQILEDLDVPADRVHSIPSGIMPPAQLTGQETAMVDLGKRLGLPQETRFIGYVGRLSPAKGLSFLMDAFSTLKQIFPELHLVFVGGGDMQPELSDQARQNGVAKAVHFMGFQNDPWPFYRAFECMVLPSTDDEGVAQVLLEAMFAECPVVASDVGGIPDVVIHRKTGLLVPPKDAASIADAVRLILADAALKTEITKKAAVMVRSDHTIEMMGKRILTIYSASISTNKN